MSLFRMNAADSEKKNPPSASPDWHRSEPSASHFAILEQMPAQLSEPSIWPRKLRWSLFWRTFFLLGAMLLVSVLVSIQLFIVLAAQTRGSFYLSASSWGIWIAVMTLLCLSFAASAAKLINRPLKDLSLATERIKEGDFEASRLSEHAITDEIREVNQGFNRMASQLSNLDQDRAVMLAGISHDLRTPLARLRLEMEMSVNDEIAREHMASDIEQLDAIIDKFLDYAKPTQLQRLRIVSLNAIIEAYVVTMQSSEDLSITLDLPNDFFVLGDDVDLTRVLANLVENARKYGKTPDTSMTQIDIAARERKGWVLLKVRDHGPGASPFALARMTKPFFRGDTARTAASGAGLGLAIVEKVIERMGGNFTLSNSSRGGLTANIRLRSAKPN